MFEFALVAPLVVAVAVFAADFTRILRTEQQLEIASRLAADVEAHMANYYGKGESPSAEAKKVAKYYLVDLAQVANGVGDVYIKGSCNVIKNPISYAMEIVSDFLKGKGWGDNDNTFLKLIGKILGGLMNFVTFRTVNYRPPRTSGSPWRNTAAGRSAWGSSSSTSKAAPRRRRRGTSSSTRRSGTACTASCR